MNKSLVELEHTYTRREIYKILGGDLVSNFPTRQGRVVYCCVSQYSHPDAPEVILVSNQGRMVESAKKFASQKEAVPVFLKQKDAELVYQGKFVVERYSDNRAEIAPFAQKAYRMDVVGILFLKRISQ
jgi:hypothetical protein